MCHQIDAGHLVFFVIMAFSASGHILASVTGFGKHGMRRTAHLSAEGLEYGWGSSG